MTNYNDITDLPPEYREQAAEQMGRALKSPQKKEPSNLELQMVNLITNLMMEDSSIPDPTLEFTFKGLSGKRRWRFDFAWPSLLIAVEVEGGTWQSTGKYGKGHGHPVRFESDCEKYNEAALIGWTVLRFTGKMIASGLAEKHIREYWQS